MIWRWSICMSVGLAVLCVIIEVLRIYSPWSLVFGALIGYGASSVARDWYRADLENRPPADPPGPPAEGTT